MRDWEKYPFPSFFILKLVDMIINPNILKKVRQIAFTAKEPTNTNVLWAKPENGLFAFYLFIDGRWESVESSSYIQLPTVSVNLSAFNNDVSYLTEESIKECENIIGSKQLEDKSIATNEDIKSLFK